MMKIIKVIIDELPESCEECEYFKRQYVFSGNDLLFCMLIAKQYSHNVSEERSPWCPLITYDEAFDWMVYEQPISKHAKDKLIRKLREAGR